MANTKNMQSKSGSDKCKAMALTFSKVVYCQRWREASPPLPTPSSKVVAAVRLQILTLWSEPTTGRQKVEEEIRQP